MDVGELQKMGPEQHPDFLWTWKSNSRSSKASIWLPYFSQAKKIPRSKSWNVEYNGGTLQLDLTQVDFLMFYGASGDVPLAFLDDAAKHGIVILIHRRNISSPYVFYPANEGDPTDLLSHQINVRSHAQKRTYVAKVLIRERLKPMLQYIPIPRGQMLELNEAKTIASVRSIEAKTTKRYWDAWYEKLSIEAHRREQHPLNAGLDAGSKFMFGIILRWLVFHKFSPNHGFLHEPTTYPSLVYDLMEPYRYLIEDATARAWQRCDGTEKDCVAKTLVRLKENLDEICYVPATRQYVRRKNLLHGAVLALRSYLLGEMKRLVIPVEGVPNGGRPPKIAYRLPGSVYDMDRKKPTVGKKEEEVGEF